MPKMFIKNLYKVNIITFIEAKSKAEILEKVMSLPAEIISKWEKVEVLEEIKALERKEE